jgi:phospholipid transport system substrate-binding protein
MHSGRNPFPTKGRGIESNHGAGTGMDGLAGNLASAGAAAGHRSMIAAMLLVLFFFAVDLSGAVASADEPVGEVKATIDEATPVFENRNLSPAERKAKLSVIAEKHFDFTYMARSALGTHWRSVTPVQRKEFVPLFENYVMDTYLNRLESTNVEAAKRALKNKVTYDAPGLATVYSTVQLETLAEPLQVNYGLHKVGQVWKLYDIIIDNVSTMAAYRDQFNKTMNEGGYAKLVLELKPKQSAPTSR